MLGSNRPSRKETRGEISQSSWNEQRACRRDVFENDKNLAGARRNNNEQPWGSVGKPIENNWTRINEQKFEFSDNRQPCTATQNRNNFGTLSYCDRAETFSSVNPRPDYSQIDFYSEVPRHHDNGDRKLMKTHKSIITVKDLHVCTITVTILG